MVHATPTHHEHNTKTPTHHEHHTKKAVSKGGVEKPDRADREESLALRRGGFSNEAGDNRMPSSMVDYPALVVEAARVGATFQVPSSHLGSK